MTEWHDVEVRFNSSDGWDLGGLSRCPDSGTPAAAVVLVHGSRHQRDAYTTLADGLAAIGVASLRFDIRGRGASLGAMPYATMAPGQRRGVVDDVEAAVDTLASTAGRLDIMDGAPLAIVAEQDTAADALAAVSDDSRVKAIVLLSPRGERVAAAVGGRPVFALVSSEDREGLRAATDAYLAGDETASRIEVFKGLGFGTTMFSTRQFEHPDAEPLESMIAAWVAARARFS